MELCRDHFSYWFRVLAGFRFKKNLQYRDWQRAAAMLASHPAVSEVVRDEA